MKKLSIYILFALFVFAISSCDNSIYDKMKEIPDAKWNMNDVLKFDVNIDDTSSFYDFSILLRHNTDYLYSNIFLFVNSTKPDGEMSRDTIELILATPEGKWIGNGSGFIKSHKILISRQFVFEDAGMYSFEFQQAMRDTILDGITDIGINVEKSKMN